MTPETVELLSWVDLEARLAAMKYTGMTLTQWAQGVKQEVQIPGPPTRIRLTKPSRPTHT